MHTDLYLYSFLGSVMAEVLSAYSVLKQGKPLPKRYRKWEFYIVWLAMAAGNSLLPNVFGITTPSAAFVLGLTAPAVLARLIEQAKKVKPNGN